MTDSSVNQPLIVPSVLPADFARIGDEVVELCDAGVDRIRTKIRRSRQIRAWPCATCAARCVVTDRLSMICCAVVHEPTAHKRTMKIP